VIQQTLAHSASLPLTLLRGSNFPHGPQIWRTQHSSHDSSSVAPISRN
jgi:hypothetical protein